MASIEDWIAKAAKDIAMMWPAGRGRADYLTDGQRSNVAATLRMIIEQNCSFESGVVYMPVPRCDACRWWQIGSVNDIGKCGRLADDSSELTHGSKAVAIEDNVSGLFATLVTAADFGCVQWEKRDG